MSDVILSAAKEPELRFRLLHFVQDDIATYPVAAALSNLSISPRYASSLSF
jgi:hypothetical protein